MLTKKVKNRILFLTLLIIFSFSALILVIKSLNNNLLYFKTPTDIYGDGNVKFGKSIRLGGMVKKNSININRGEIRFIITDLKNEIIVSYKGTVPNLFLEGKGVIAEGFLKDKKYFIAERILAKHDENYMPPELKEVLEKNAK
jgi:cytochrome c-type biogenesis protein CcmE|tara:strand:- start:718 stop:1146 length:429 start_codon:yes stop_codon:yes gene_type:complete